MAQVVNSCDELHESVKQERYTQVAEDYKLHPDDDCDRIMDLLCERFPEYRDS